MTPVSGSVRTLLRLEGLAILLLSLAAYSRLSGRGWGLFFGLLLVPDVSLLGYLGGPRIGAVVYNAAHTYVVPAALGLAAVYWLGPFWLAAAIVWIAHIGMDRAIGYGLKLTSGFSDTHLGVIGRQHGQG